MTNLLIEQINENRRHVSTDTYRATWKEIIDNYRDGIIAIEPDFQRTFRWDLKQQTEFIESVILGLPFPPIFLIQEEEDSAQTVLDGVQRICTILKFFSKEISSKTISDSFPLASSYIVSEGSAEELEEEEFYQEDSDNQLDKTPLDNDLNVPTTLLKGGILDSLENYTAETLPGVTVRAIKQARVDVILLEPESDLRIRYQVFTRLNRAGARLSDQEVRNCAARLGGSDFPNKLKDLAKTQSIVQAMNLPLTARRKMQIEEYILRMLALVYKKETLNDKNRIMRALLDDFMLEASKKNIIGIEQEGKIIKTFEVINEAISDGSSFKGKRGFSTTRFDVIATGVYQNIDFIDAEFVKKKIEGLKISETDKKSNLYKDLIGAGSNTINKIKGRIEYGKEWFNPKS